MEKGLEGSLGKLHGSAGVWVSLTDWAGAGTGERRFQQPQGRQCWGSGKCLVRGKEVRVLREIERNFWLISPAEELGLCR